MVDSIRILKPEDAETDLITFVRRRSLIPIVGSGFSCGLKASKGLVPSGGELQNFMLDELEKSGKFAAEEMENIRKDKFSEVCDYYEGTIEDKDRYPYLVDHFDRCQIPDGDQRMTLFEIDWPYIYTLNIDDAIENSSEFHEVIVPKRALREGIFDDHKCVIKLHGDIAEIRKYKDSFKVFSSKEYALSIMKNKELLDKLKNDYQNQNIVYIGCSLCDEMDLDSLTDVKNYSDDIVTRNGRVFLFMKGDGKLNQTLNIRFKKCGVTDVVMFKEYTDIYRFLHNLAEKAKSTFDTDLNQYSKYRISDLPKEEKNQNREYFFQGKELLDLRENTFTYPAYFIHRELEETVKYQIGLHSVLLIYGNKISGRTYFLSGLYKRLYGRKVYYFDSRTKLASTSLNVLLKDKCSVIIIDAGNSDQELIEEILLRGKEIKNQGISVIIGCDRNDPELNGWVRLKRNTKEISEEFYAILELKNSPRDEAFRKETAEINKIFPYLELPPYDNKRNFLDQLLYAEEEQKVVGKYNDIKVDKSNFRELAALIAIAMKIRLTSQDIYNLELQDIFEDKMSKYRPLIERIDTMTLEKSGEDISSIKYILNAPYWLRRELGRYSKRGDSQQRMIVDAYKYIAAQLNNLANGNLIYRRKVTKDYIFYDNINETFLTKDHGSIKLIVDIYEGLNQILADDFQVQHQYAKCLLNYAYSMTNIKDKQEILERAKTLASLANDYATQAYAEATSNNKLPITMAHINYTEAAIEGEICEACNYEDLDEVRYAAGVLAKALESEYNWEDYKKNTRIKVTKSVRQLWNRIMDEFSEKIPQETLTKLVMVNRHINSWNV